MELNVKFANGLLDPDNGPDYYKLDLMICESSTKNFNHGLLSNAPDFICKVHYWFLSWCHSLVHWSFSSFVCSARLQRKTWIYCMHLSSKFIHLLQYEFFNLFENGTIKFICRICYLYSGFIRATMVSCVVVVSFTTTYPAGSLMRFF